jgi:hypothetical protein
LRCETDILTANLASSFMCKMRRCDKKFNLRSYPQFDGIGEIMIPTIRLLHLVISVTLIIVLSGCSSTNSIQSRAYNIANLDDSTVPKTGGVPLLDVRPPEPTTSSQVSKDVILTTAFNPPIPEILSRRLAGADLTFLSGKAVELHMLRTVIEEAERAPRTVKPSSLILPGSGAVGYIAGKIAEAVTSPSKADMGIRFATTIVVGVEGRVFRATGYSWKRIGNFEADLTHSVDQAIKHIIFELRYPDREEKPNDATR